MDEKDKYDLALGADILEVDTSSGDVTIEVGEMPQLADDDCLVMHDGKIVFFDWDEELFPEATIELKTNKKAVATEVENIELKKRVEELERELETLKGRKK